MIVRSRDWKREILRQIDWLQSHRSHTDWSEKTCIRLEQTVVWACYTVCKLDEAGLLAPELAHAPVPMVLYPPHRRPDLKLTDGPEERYQLRLGQALTRDLLFLCHQVVANHLFAPALDEEKALAGIYVTSPHRRRVGLYKVTLESLIEVFERVARWDGV